MANLAHPLRAARAHAIFDRVSATLRAVPCQLGPQDLDVLYALRKQIAANPYLFSVQVITGVQEVITASGCGFGEPASFSTGGPSMTGRKFPMECKSINIF